MVKRSNISKTMSNKKQYTHTASREKSRLAKNLDETIENVSSSIGVSLEVQSTKNVLEGLTPFRRNVKLIKHNAPVSARKLVRERATIQLSQPQEFINNPLLDKFGPHVYNLSRITPNLIKKMMFRFKHDELYVGELPVPLLLQHQYIDYPWGSNQNDADGTKTPEIPSGPGKEELEMYISCGIPLEDLIPPGAMTEETKPLFKKNGELLLTSVLQDINCRFGSMENYVNLCETNRPSGIQPAKIDGHYVTNTYLPSPVHQCACCGTYNTMNNYSAPANLAKAYFDEQIKLAEDGDVNAQIVVKRRGLDASFMVPDVLLSNYAWKDITPGTWPHRSVNDYDYTFRCANCWHSLEVGIEEIHECASYTDRYHNLIDMRGNSILDQLITTGVGDIYSDLAAEDRTTLLQHDENIVKKYLRTISHRVIKVPTNLDPACHSNLRSHYPGYTQKLTSNMFAVKPELYSELCMAAAWLIDRNPDGNYRLDSTSIDLVDRSIMYTNRQEWMVKLKKTSPDFKSRPMVILGEKLRDINTVYELLMQQSIVYYFIIKRSSDALMDGTGATYTKSNITSIYVDGKTDPLTVNASTYELLETNQAIRVGANIILNNTLLDGIHVTIGSLSLDNRVTLTNRLSQIDDQTAVTIPVPDIMSIEGIMPIINWKHKTYSVKLDLFRTLCIRNMDGRATTTQLRQYAVAFSNTVYNVGETRITNRHITYDDIDFHVACCRAMMMHENQVADASMAYNKVLTCLGPLRALLPQLTNGLTGIILETLTRVVEIIMDKAGADIDTVLSTVKTVKFFNVNALENVWEKLKDTSINAQLSPLRVSNAEVTKTENFPNCVHHRALINCMHKGENNCKCCNLPHNNQSSLCDCCQPVKLTVDPNNYNMSQQDDNPGNKNLSKSSSSKPNSKSKQKQSKPKQNKPNTSTNQIESSADNSETKQTSTTPEKPLIKLTKEKLKLDVIDEEALMVATNVPKMFVDGLHNYPELTSKIQPARELQLYLPYMLAGETILKNKELKIVELINQKNDSINTCGYNALKSATDGNLVMDLDSFREVTGCNENFRTDDMFRYMRIKGENLIIAIGSEFHVSRHNKSDYYYCVIHSSATTKNDIDHYYHGKLQVIDKPNTVLTSNFEFSTSELEVVAQSLGLNFDSFVSISMPAADNLMLIALAQASRAEFDHETNTIGRLVSVGQDEYWQFPINNHVNNVQSGKIYKKIRKTNSAIRMLIDNYDQPSSQQITHKDSGIPERLEKAIDDYCNSLAHSIRYCKTMLYQQDKHKYLKSYCTVETRQTKNGVWISGADASLKTFDHCAIQYRSNKTTINKIAMVIGSRGDGKLFLSVDGQLPTKVRVAALKISSGSAIRTLIAMSGTLPDREELTELVRKSTGIVGVPGSGKTTTIINNVNEETLVVTMTRQARLTLSKSISGIKPNIKVISAEMLLNYPLSKFNKVIIDEATMLDYTYLIPIANGKIQRLEVYGDNGQIGFVDMSMDAGIRATTNLLTICQEYGNIEERNATYRLGDPAVSELKAIIPNFSSLSSSKTSWTWLNCANDAERIVWHIDNHQSDLILTPYQETKHQLEQLVLTSTRRTTRTITVNTTHSSQGLEVESVMVVLKATTGGQWGLNGDANYLASALTRATKQVIVLVIGRPSITNLSEATSKLGGSDCLLYTVIDEMEKGSSSKKLTELIQNHDISVESEKKDDDYHTTIKHKLGNIKLLITRQKVSIVSKPSFIPEVKIFDVLTNLTNQDTEIDTTNAPEKLIKYAKIDELQHKFELTETTAINKVRVLSWLVESTGTRELVIPLKHESLTITKTGGCCLWCGISVTYQGATVTVNGQYRTVIKRVCTADNKIGAIMLMNWFKNNDNCDIFGNLTTTKNFSINMYKERIKTLPYLFNNPDMHLDNFCDMLKDKDSQLMQMKFPILGNKSKFRNQHNFVIQQLNRKNWLKRNQFKLIIHYKSKTEKLVNLSGSDLTMLYNTTVLDMAANTEVTDKTYLFGQGTGIDGLNMTLEEHQIHNTVVARRINAIKSKLLSKKARSTTDILWLTIGDENLINKLKLEQPNLSINKFKSNNCKPALLHLIENYGTMLIGKDNQSTYIYAGYTINAPSQQNQHYAEYLSLTSDFFSSTMWSDTEQQLISDIKVFNEVNATTIQPITSWTQLQHNYQMQNNANRPVVNLGCKLPLIHPEKIAEMLSNNYSVYGIIPNPTANNGLFKVENSCLIFKDHNITMNCLNNYYYHATTGKPVRTDNLAFKLNILVHVLGFIIVKVEPIPVNSTVVAWINSELQEPARFKAKVPWLNVDVRSLLAGEPFLDIKELLVDKKFYRMLMMRLTAEDKTVKDAMAYARSLASVEVTNATYIGSTSQLNLSSVIDTCRLAIMHRTALLSQLSVITKLLNKASDVSIIRIMLKNMLTTALSLTDKLPGLLSAETINSIISNVIPQLNNNYLSELIIANDNLLIKLGHTSGKLVMYHPETEPHYPPESEAEIESYGYEEDDNESNLGEDDTTEDEMPEEVNSTKEDVSSHNDQTNNKANDELQNLTTTNDDYESNTKLERLWLKTGTTWSDSWLQKKFLNTLTDNVKSNKLMPTSITNIITGDEHQFIRQCEQIVMDWDNSESRYLIDPSSNQFRTRLTGKPQQVLLITLGSTGDVLPLITLANCLHQNGIPCTIMTHYDHFNLIPSEHGFWPITFSIKQQLDLVIKLFCPYSGKKINRKVTEAYYQLILASMFKNTFELDCRLVIAGAITPAAECFAAKYKCDIYWIRPYPWLDLPIVKLKWVRSIANASAQMLITIMGRKILEKYNVTPGEDTRLEMSKQLATFNLELLPEHMKKKYTNAIITGPLTAKSSYVGKADDLMELTINNSEEEWGLVSYGSVSSDNSVKIASNLAKAITKHNLNVVVNLSGSKHLLEFESFMGLTSDGVTKYNNKLVWLSTGFSYSRLLKKFQFIVNHCGAGVFNEAIDNAVPIFAGPIFGDQPVWIEAGSKLGIVHQGPNYFQLETYATTEQFISTGIAKLPSLKTNSIRAKALKSNIVQPSLTSVLGKIISIETNVKIDNVPYLKLSRTLELPVIKCCRQLNMETGEYICQFGKLTCLYNPTNTNTCVIDSMFAAIGDENLLTNVADGYNTHFIHKLALQYCFNLIIVSGKSIDEITNNKGSVGRGYIKFSNRPTLIVGRVMSSDVGHCCLLDGSVVDITTMDEYSTAGAIPDLELPVSKEIAFSFQSLLSEGYQGFNKDLQYKLLLNQLEKEWLTRYEILTGICVMTKHHNRLIVSEDKRVMRPQLCLLCGPTNMRFGWCCAEFINDQTIYSYGSFTERVNTEIIINLNVPIESKTKQKLAKIIHREETNKLYSLSRYDQSQLAQQHGITTDIIHEEAKGKVIVYNYENRSHHLHNSEELMITMVNQGKLLVQWGLDKSNPPDSPVEKTKNQPIDRLIMKNGKWYRYNEFTNNVLAAIESKLNNMKLYRTGALGEVNMQKIVLHKLYKTVESKSGAKMLDYTILPEKTLTIEPDGTLTAKLILSRNYNLLEDASSIDWSSITAKMLMLQQGTKYVVFDQKDVSIIITEDLHIYYHQFVKGGANEGSSSIDVITTAMGAQSKSNNKWFEISNDDNLNLTALEQDYNIDFMNNLQLTSIPACNAVTPRSANELTNQSTYIINSVNWCVNLTQGATELTDELTTDVIDLWELTDLSDQIIKYAPLTVGSLKSKEKPYKISKCRKHTMTQFPIRSRPVLTKLIYMEHNTITGRLMSIANIRKIIPNVRQTTRRLATTYFKPTWESACSEFQSSKITYSSNKTKQWIAKHHNASKVLKDLETFLVEGNQIRSIADINIHLKLESLLKDPAIQSFKQQQPRSIMWQHYYVAAIYSPIFMEVKKRLKFLLKEHIIYADGYKASDLSKVLSTIRAGKYYYESDLKKQDRQTDKPLLDVEMEIYRLLGVDDKVLNSWRTVHEKWRFKGTYSKGLCQEMRTTGQATTAIGNVITNMQANLPVIEKYGATIKLMMMLGDDNLMNMEVLVNTKEAEKNIAVTCNMQSIGIVRTKGGNFCSMVCHTRSDGTIGLGPDYVRLKNRFEVTNGVHETTETNLEMRSQSYLSMIGSTPEAIRIIKEKNWTIKPEQWYEQNTLIQATAKIYNTDENYVIDNYNKLMQMIDNQQIFEHEFTQYEASRKM
ncbi:polyprotein [Brown algae endornavirus 2]|nr:polyprotein [Brown algae endornavirus 2]